MSKGIERGALGGNGASTPEDILVELKVFLEERIAKLEAYFSAMDKLVAIQTDEEVKGRLLGEGWAASIRTQHAHDDRQGHLRRTYGPVFDDDGKVINNRYAFAAVEFEAMKLELARLAAGDEPASEYTEYFLGQMNHSNKATLDKKVARSGRLARLGILAAALPIAVGGALGVGAHINTTISDYGDSVPIPTEEEGAAGVSRPFTVRLADNDLSRPSWVILGSILSFTVISGGVDQKIAKPASAAAGRRTRRKYRKES